MHNKVGGQWERQWAVRRFSKYPRWVMVGCAIYTFELGVLVRWPIDLYVSRCVVVEPLHIYIYIKVAVLGHHIHRKVGSDGRILITCILMCLVVVEPTYMLRCLVVVQPPHITYYIY